MRKNEKSTSDDQNSLQVMARTRFSTLEPEDMSKILHEIQRTPKEFDVLHCGDVEKLIKKRQSLTDPILYYAYAEEIYSIVMRAHLNTGHGGRDKMLKEVNKKYANVTRHALNLFKEMCEECQLKKGKLPFEKNNSHHSGINRSPYKAMFGCDAKIGLSSSSLPQEILGSLQTEEDLIQHFQSSDKPAEINNDNPNELSSDKPNEPGEVSQLNAALNLSETEETELDVHVCAVCENPCFSNIQCSTCAQYIHELCSKGNISDTITCHLCSNEEVIRNERRHASDSMTKQAVRMRNLSERVLTEVDVRANVDDLHCQLDENNNRCHTFNIDDSNGEKVFKFSVKQNRHPYDEKLQQLYYVFVRRKINWARTYKTINKRSSIID
ncbi:unnamed protein product [Mytilus coruscus]|uniref:Integrase zinc-binding domain-containing protein n=1 Tax=Mytilus coruscus TaxID=42192 RepID=A0A6J8C1F9_MYTCO|nr:unnamed protein product [Mytilus coruscus]